MKRTQQKNPRTVPPHVCRFNRDGERSIRRIEFCFRNTFRVVEPVPVLFSRPRPYASSSLKCSRCYNNRGWSGAPLLPRLRASTAGFGDVSPALAIPARRRWCWTVGLLVIAAAVLGESGRTAYAGPASRWQVFGRDGDVQKPSGTRVHKHAGKPCCKQVVNMLLTRQVS